MKRIFTILLLQIFALSFAQIPAGYYDAANGLTGYPLKTKLHEIIKAGHQDKGYNALMTAYKTGDLDKYYENDNTILDMYSENPTGSDPYIYIPGQRECGNYNSENDCYNREHIFPQGFFNQAAPMRSDYHHIYPTDGYVNGRRSNFPFGRVGTASWTSMNGSKVGSSNFPGYSGTVFEPVDEFKGDIARALLYFVTRYEDRIQNFDHSDANNPQDGSRNRGYDQWYINLLILWHRQDPVSQREIDRNNFGYTYQGNRNPYIDHPEYVEQIWTLTILATDENSVSKNSLKISNNPVRNGELIVEGNDLHKVASAEIYSVTGQLIQKVANPFKNSNKIILKKLAKGVYILKAGEASTKFIVQ